MKKSLLSLFLLVLIIVPTLIVSPSVASSPDYYIFTDPTSFYSSKYFQVYALTGTISNDGSTYNTSLHPSSITIDTTKEYALFPIYLSPSEDNIARAEFCIPASYGGSTIELIESGPVYTVMDGAAGYALSVPHFYNNSDRFNSSAYPGAPPTDWAGAGAPSLANASGMGGSLYRVQLAVATEAPLQLRITTYYATSPAVGFDGVDDYVKKTTDMTGGRSSYHINVVFFPNRFMGAGTGITLVDFQFNVIILVYQAGQILYMTFNDSSTAGWLDPPNAPYQVLNAWRSETLTWDNVNGASIDTNGTVTSASYGVGKFLASSANYRIGYGYAADKSFLNGKIALVNATNLLINASSFSGGADTTVTDFSGAGNHGTAYGNVQYKAYTGTGFYAPMTFTTNAHSTLTFSDNDSLPALATSYSPLTLNGSLLLNDTTPTMDDWVDAGITIYNSTHITLPITLTQSGVTLNTITYAYFNGSFTLPFTTVQKPYNNLYQLTLTTYYSTLTTVPYSFYITTPYLTFYGFTIYSSTASPIGLGYLTSSGKLQLLATGNLTIVQPTDIVSPDHITLNGIPYYQWSYSATDSETSVTATSASQYTANIYYKSGITTTVNIIFVAIALMSTTIIILVSLLILTFIQHYQNIDHEDHPTVSYETGIAIAVIAIILLIGVWVISSLWGVL